MLFDPFRGLLGVIVLASLHSYRDYAILLLSESPFLAAEADIAVGLAGVYRRPTMCWAIVIGAAAGYAGDYATTRCGLFRVSHRRRHPVAIGKDLRALIPRGAIMIAAAAPFLLLLIIQNAGVTGHWLELAEGYWNHRNFPHPRWAFMRSD